jgi:DNA-binding CsgD family transcriptional regulator
MKAKLVDSIEIISRLYDSVLDAGSLAATGEALVKLAGGHTGALVNRASRLSVSVFADMSYNVDLTSAQIFAKHFATLSPCYRDEWMARPGDVVTSSNHIVADDYKSSVFYNEWAKIRDHWDYVGIILSKDSSTMSYYAILRPHRAGLVSEIELRRVKAIAPHLKRAYAMSSLLRKYKIEAQSLGDLIAGAGFGVVLATATRHVVYVNEVAEASMRLRRGICYAHGRICAVDPQTDRKLESLVLDSGRPNGLTLPGGSIPLLDASGTMTHVIHVMPLSAATTAALLDKDHPAVGLFIVDLQRETTFDLINRFALIYRLTPGEARVLQRLVAGEGLVEVAERLGISEGTARTHLKHIFYKTDTHRQTELLRLFFQATVPLGAPPRSNLRVA